MRGTPVGAQPTCTASVGLTGSVESVTARGPHEGFVARYCCLPHAVISGTTSLCEINEYPAYSRALGGIFGSHMPEKSGSPHAVFGTCHPDVAAPFSAEVLFPEV